MEFNYNSNTEIHTYQYQPWHENHLVEGEALAPVDDGFDGNRQPQEVEALAIIKRTNV